MALGKTGIDYLTKTWGFYTGCLHTLKECPCADKCWARSMAKRFHWHFEPTLHEDKLFDPLHHKKPERIGVCFTGDIGGEWVDVDERIYHEWAENQDYFTLKENVKMVMENCPQHQFFVLTKNLKGLIKWGKWPDNCFVGATVCNDGMMFDAVSTLRKIQAKHKWLSIEPLKGQMHELSGEWLKDAGISWVVIGGWSTGKIQPKVEWISEIVEATDKSGIKVFLKDNLNAMFAKNDCELFSQYKNTNLFKVVGTDFKDGENGESIYEKRYHLRQELPEFKNG